MKRSSTPLKLVQSKQHRSPVQVGRIPHLRNWLALTLLTGLYSYVVLATQEGGLHLVAAPLVIAPLGYHAFKGRSFIRKVLPATVPWAGAPILVAAGFDNAIEAVFVHSFLIGMVVVQVWEASLWLGGYIIARLGRLRNRLPDHSHPLASGDSGGNVVPLNPESKATSEHPDEERETR
jgi:hypothetical protein